ncbi:AraC-like ligand-binding domain-containing protein [Sphaerisporangium corydalis]|uniref:Helix-turn-helix domain-containing protein n=1 Tax=Sphaerisporangium corydalis TaxID=1441875 RepID=A0ABV9EKF1_9ACTN|nr:helix-turn-helix domain-containing protein [Sphaerisporangium corydalis]
MEIYETEHLPVPERLELLREHMSRVVGPVEITSADPPRFHIRSRVLAMGAVRVSALALTGSCGLRRTPEMISRSDPEMFQLVLPVHGDAAVTQERRCARLRPYELTLYGTSRPYHLATVSDQETRGFMVEFPRALVPLPPERIERLTATPLPGHEGVGALLPGFLTRLTTDAGQYGPCTLSRLGTTFTDLITSLLAAHLDSRSAVPPEARQRTLLLSVHAFIQRHLADERLCPSMIATAHGISLRQLHRLFEDEDVTVSGWIRAQRLERCRRDLADPALRDRAAHAVAARWGFAAPPHFTRAFQSAYGISPSAYRRLALQEAHA